MPKMSVEYYQLLQLEAHSLLHNLQENYLAKIKMIYYTLS